jgi:hypothetical protein
MTRRGRGRSPFSLFSFQDIITCVSGIIILVTLILAVELTQRKQGSPQVQTAKLAAQLREAIAEAQEEAARLESELNRRTTRAQQLAGISPDEIRRDLHAITEQIKSLDVEIASLRTQEEEIAQQDAKLQAKRFDAEKENKKLAGDESTITALEAKLRQLREQNRLFYNPRTSDGKQIWLVQIERDRTLVAPAGSSTRPQIFAHEFALFRQTSFEKWLATRSASSDFIFFLVRPEGRDEFLKLRSAAGEKNFPMGFDLLGGQQSAADAEKGAAGP